MSLLRYLISLLFDTSDKEPIELTPEEKEKRDAFLIMLPLVKGE